MEGRSGRSLKPITFEATKAGQVFGAEGMVLKLTIDPEETPPEIASAKKGVRYMVVMVEITDQNDELGQKAVAMAGAVCKERNFWRFLSTWPASPILVENEAGAAHELRLILGLKSRSELRTNVEARDAFYEINREYLGWLASIQSP